MMEHLIAFFAVVLLDFFFAFYTRAAAEGKSFASSAYAMLIMAANVFIITGFVSNPEQAPAAIAGAFVGTYLAIELDKRLGEKGVKK